jgi:hypothetical protein
VDFKVPYALAMSERDPKGFNELSRSGKLEQHLQEVSLRAHQMLKDLLADKPRDRHGLVSQADEAAAEEVVMATLIEFPTPEKDQNPEPPDDLTQKR